MSEKTISFRADAGKIDELDQLAAAQDRPRNYLINQAINNYIELKRWAFLFRARGAGMHRAPVLRSNGVIATLPLLN